MNSVQNVKSCDDIKLIVTEIFADPRETRHSKWETSKNVLLDFKHFELNFHGGADEAN